MNLNTRLLIIFKQLLIKIKKSFFVYNTTISLGLFFLFFGFLLGNLFGSFLTFLRQFIIWDGFIIAFLLIIIECINFFNYTSKKQMVFLLPKNNLKNSEYSVSKELFLANNFFYKLFNNKLLLQEKKLFLKNINLLKIGVMLGFFIEAFKVGS
uniref:Hypothetical chloroplast RF20 n=1 Tax=Edaphochlorella mirabilis TaxID=3083 RepID=A0A097KKT2_9CHLO|nr:hypothetical chloroplast RF20 [Edaphochlorella mirabilis]AIT93791.1 hypothetical chloroplast RF20 [Edaphochlorella mirabilis]